MTLVCFALEEEAAPFREKAKENSEISILITGIGKQNAETALQEFLAANSPKVVLTCGFAGGLNPKLNLGEVVFDASDEILRTRLIAAGAKPAEFFCAGRIVTTVAEKKLLRDGTGCEVVEMESEAIYRICYKHDVACVTVRVISDPAGEDLPLDFNRLANADLSLNYGKLAWAIAKSPGIIPALFRLQKQTHFAAQRLAAVLAQVIWPR